jgi:hypothetical protein
MSLIKAIHGRKNNPSIGDAIRRVARTNVRIRCAVEPSVAGCTPKPPQWGRSMDDYYELIGVTWPLPDAFLAVTDASGDAF